jgi:hypothetical protein
MSTEQEPRKRTVYKWISREGCTSLLYDVGILADGSLHNPNGYPEDEVRRRVEWANEQRRLRRSNGARKAAATRSKRRERRVYAVVEKLKAGGKLPPASRCVICTKLLTDPESIERGIGSDCWQDVLHRLERREQS